MKSLQRKLLEIPSTVIRCQFHPHYSTAFALVDPESIRTLSSCQYHFKLLGSTSIKSVRRTLMKSTPGVNPIIKY